MEEIPWADGKHPVTQAYAWFLASWAKRLSWKEVAEVFQRSWEVVFGAVERAVAYGFRTYHGLKMPLYHALGPLPEPRFTHRLS